MPSLKTTHLIQVRYIGASNTKPSRIALVSQRFENDRVVFSYDSKFGVALEQAAQWLQDHGFNPTLQAEGRDCAGYLTVTEFKPLKESK